MEVGGVLEPKIGRYPKLKPHNPSCLPLSLIEPPNTANTGIAFLNPRRPKVPSGHPPEPVWLPLNPSGCLLNPSGCPPELLWVPAPAPFSPSHASKVDGPKYSSASVYVHLINVRKDL